MAHRLALALLAAMLAAGSAAAPSAAEGTLTVSRPWARQTAPTQRNGVAYLTLRNDGDTPDRLVGARSDVAGKVQLHEHSIDASGVARMRPVDAVELPAHSTVTLAPGGLHLMMIDLARPLEAGQHVPLTLELENAGEVPVEVEVLSMRAAAPEAPGHAMGHGAPKAPPGHAMGHDAPEGHDAHRAR